MKPIYQYTLHTVLHCSFSISCEQKVCDLSAISHSHPHPSSLTFCQVPWHRVIPFIAGLGHGPREGLLSAEELLHAPVCMYALTHLVPPDTGAMIAGWPSTGHWHNNPSALAVSGCIHYLVCHKKKHTMRAKKACNILVDCE